MEFSSRYGDAGPPSSLRLCRACAGMGAYPREIPGAVGSVDERWEWLACADCQQTARCSWAATARRVPLWLWKGFVWCWTNGPNSACGRDWLAGYTYLQRWWITVKIAWLCDLGWRIR